MCKTTVFTWLVLNEGNFSCRWSLTYYLFVKKKRHLSNNFSWGKLQGLAGKRIQKQRSRLLNF